MYLIALSVPGLLLVGLYEVSRNMQFESFFNWSGVLVLPALVVYILLSQKISLALIYKRFMRALDAELKKTQERILGRSGRSGPADRHRARVTPAS